MYYIIWSGDSVFQDLAVRRGFAVFRGRISEVSPNSRRQKVSLFLRLEINGKL